MISRKTTMFHRAAKRVDAVANRAWNAYYDSQGDPSIAECDKYVEWLDQQASAYNWAAANIHVNEVMSA